MIKAEIVAHSKNIQGDELISVLCTFPRMILAEVNTHRMLSKNTSSSRAIPFNKMVQAIQDNPFIPIAFQKEHSGMQGNEYWEGADHDLRVEIRKEAIARSIHSAKDEHHYGVTKQLANRHLEPHMWTTMLITGSKEGWDNFFKLRCPTYESPANSIETENLLFKSKKDMINFYIENDFKIGAGALKMWTSLDWLKANKGQAEIHMMALAEAIWDAKNESTPKLLKPGEWHIPFENKISVGKIFDEVSIIIPNATIPSGVKISTAMAARTSYTIVGEEKEVNYQNMVNLHDRLITQQPPHSSPMEHCSKCMTDEERMSFVKGKLQFGTELEDGGFDVLQPNESELGWCYNHKGFIPYRYLIDNNLTL